MKALGIILAGGNSSRMKNLSDKRAISAMPIGCSYRCIDFTLSNMTNSHIQTVAVLSQYNARSLNEHLNSSKWWNFGRKQGGLFLFTPTVTAENSWWYRGTADAMWQNIDFLKKRHEPYVVIANGDCVYKMDFNPVLDYHIQKQADITVVCAKAPVGDDISRFGTVKIDPDGMISEFEEKPMMAHSNIVSTGVYVIRRRKLIELLEQCNSEGRYNFVTDILIRYKGMKKIYGYMLDSYWSNISTVESYYRTNMDFLNPEVRDYFFRQNPKIYSKAQDLPPAKFNIGSQVHNSLVGSGTIINSTVENSVLFKKVFVGNNSVIRNSIILNGAYIGDNVHVENCIVESNETLISDTDYIGEDGIRIVADNNNRFGV
ncbi:MAG: glucose-1-phosphate adenylyltransferase subunit GlgD [Lachnospiraceae bacterium]|jgi:glucose-1-phosphate adenylyltransferase|nr:glucose-1-phosphate adenylyltransferase subunit GlgD [Lachnospiraceae bacterium]MBQ2577109.1 glucose-1-phosphate adenylyltransferase subunit GlgD [Lachnospiraceae bacterium]MBQ5485394.1 glucose-1-phosphate adenylyltransferase subunit GlgD [Lachnospiraceae bacterium]MCR4732125.1 glucose-1-phosphate adenylyltransferase subunit GlgD [Lachnospiraceae bacterium]